MYISNLTIHGFKSFAKKERLTFGEGITVIVGPNGCGKTNIVDAIRWVLGEQKYSVLRSGKMGDVIFNGAKGVKPLSVCETSLTVHNNKGKLPVEYNDIEISRRVYRNGESEYFLNRTPCRLKDIQDLFVDTGMGADAYSVIELKMIEQILSETGDDRKRLFEEAAGVNKYKRQRQAALRKFETIRLDLERVNDIIQEVDQKVHALGLQLKRFKRYEKLTEELEEREIQLAALRIHELHTRLEPVKKRIQEIQELQESASSDQTVKEQELERVQGVYEAQQQELETLRRGLTALEEERESVRNSILIWTEQGRAAETTVERLEAEKARNRVKLEQLFSQIDEYNAEVEALAPELERQLKAYGAKKAEFDQRDQAYREAQTGLEQAQADRWEAQQKLASDQSLLDRTQLRLQEKEGVVLKIQNQLEGIKAAIQSTAKEQKQLDQEYGDLNKALERSRTMLETVAAELSAKAERQKQLQAKRQQTIARIELVESQRKFYAELLEQQEGYPEGVRYLLGHRNQFKGVIDTVGNLLTVDEQYGTALQSALGETAQYLVVKDRRAALDILNAVKGKKVGALALLPLKEISALKTVPGSPPKEKGIIGRAADLVSVKPEYRGLAELLLGNLLLVEDLSVLKTTKPFKDWELADLSGNYFSSQMVMKTSSPSPESLLIGRKDKLKALESRITALKQDLVNQDQELESSDPEMEELTRKHKDLSDEVAKQTEILQKLEVRRMKNQYGMSQSRERKNTLKEEIKVLQEEIQQVKESCKKLKPGLERAQQKIETLKTAVQEANAALLIAQGERDRFHQQLQDLRIELVNLENKRDNLNFQLRAARETKDELLQRQDAIQQEIASLNQRRVELQTRIEEGNASLNAVKGKIQKERSILDLKQEATRETFQMIETLQAAIRNEQQSRETYLEELKQQELELARSEEQITLIKERIRDRYNRSVPGDLTVEWEAEELEQRIDRIKRSIENIGPINMAVQDEYNEESQRLITLNEQRADLLEAEENLRETIQKIDRIARKQFQETFDQIKVNFEKLFTLFFEGGQASLSLVGDPDPLEADITIQAQPPGKRNQTLRMLSAGEKSLTAIALLFAIYQYKPSPYCILDEVDAPLDDVNIKKFTRVLTQFSRETQFIIVTHNKLTMEVADYMYGVTMEQKGISKLVSVRFNGQAVEAA